MVPLVKKVETGAKQKLNKKLNPKLVVNPYSIFVHLPTYLETDAKKIRLAQYLAVSKKSTILIQSS